jgi:FtsP/CotA-like multicopper oxidase with cupredoxin domain
VEWDRFSTQIAKVVTQDEDSHVALHWHGLSMKGMAEQDGAYGFTSNKIAPGQNTTYRFVLGQQDAGTHWWHSHVGMSRSDGLWGLFIVHSNTERLDLQAHANVTYDQEAVLAFNDHYHKPGVAQLSWFMSTYSLGFEPTPESSLINGRNRFRKTPFVAPHTDLNQWSSKYSHVTLRRDRPTRLRLINTGAVGNQYVSIDHHILKVIEADGVLITPFFTKRLAVAPGQRYSVIIGETDKLQDKHDKFWIRTVLDHKCFNMPNPSLNLTGLAVLSYEHRGQTKMTHDGLDLRRKGLRWNTAPSSQDWPVLEVEKGQNRQVGCEDVPMKDLQPLLPTQQAPYINFSEKSTVSQRHILYAKMPKLSEHGLAPMGFINATSWRSEDDNLLQKYRASESFSAKYNKQGLVVELPRVHNESQTIEVVIHNGDDGPHPFHLHGHKFWVMETAQTRYAQSIYKDRGQWRSYNLEKAPLRDTVLIPRKGYGVLRWKADNPGVWAFHW